MKLLLPFLLFFFCCCTLLQAQTPYHPGKLMVQMREGHQPREVLAALKAADPQNSSLELSHQVSKHMRIWLLSFDPATVNDSRLLFQARSLAIVQEAQFDHVIAARDTLVPNDLELGSQWQWINNGLGGGVVDADVDADGAWVHTTGGLTNNGDTIVVCVVDDGTDLNHPDLKANIWFNYDEIPNNNIDDDQNGWIDDINGWNAANNNNFVDGGSHGVNVAGMIGAVGDNEIGGTGVNWSVKLMTVVYGGASESQVLAAYEYPLIMRKTYNETNGAKGAFVVATNSSWGVDGGQPDDAPLWCNYYDSLGFYGILSVGATTNQDDDVDIVGDLPTACPSPYFLGVARTGISDDHAGGYGATTVHLGAPGIDIYTTEPGGGYTSTTGTSFASPLVAGIVGLLFSAPCASLANLAQSSPAEAVTLIRNAIMEGVDNIPSLDGKVITNGRANVANSMELLLQNCAGCRKPSSVSIVDITQNNASVLFTPYDSATVTLLRYRKEGTETWTVVENAASPFQLSELDLCTAYLVQFKSICGDSSTTWSNSYVFATQGCCVAPEASISTFEQSIVITWDSVATALTYKVQIKIGDEITSSTVDANVFSLVSLPIDSCTELQWRVSTNCTTGLFGEGVWQTFTTLGCGACLDLDYCIPTGGSTEDEYIANVTFGTLDNSSEGSEGYDNFAGTLDAPSFLQGYSYGIALTPGFADNSYNEYFKAWIDFNQDGDFDDYGELVFDPGVASGTVDGIVSIPTDAALGVTRCRVVMKYTGAFGSAPQFCQEFEYGEYEDYCVNILPYVVPNCSVVQEVDTLETYDYAVVLIWTEPDSAVSYNAQFKKVGSSTWTTYENVVQPLSVDGLDQCTDYEFKLRAFCENGEVPYSQTVVVKTKCVIASSDVEAGQFTIQPNPFTTEVQIKVAYPLAVNGVWVVRNALGQEVASQTAVSGQSSFTISNLDTLPSGAYFLQLLLEDGRLSSKLLIKQ